MKPAVELIKSESCKIDVNGPIEFEQLKREISANGPFCMQFFDLEVDFTINITACMIEGCTCNEDVISITQSSGFTSLSTLIDRETLEEFESLSAVANGFIHDPRPLFEPRAEQQYLEAEVRRHLGIDPMEIYKNGIPEQGLEETLSDICKKDFWRAQNLRAIFQRLMDHRAMLEMVGTLERSATIGEVFPSPNDLIDQMNEHYIIGFLTGRLISEHFVRYEIEPLARKGIAYDDVKKKSSEASGRSSSENRHRRVDAMLSKMEWLVAESPALGRTGLKMLANLAIKDASREDPKLWAQGKGQMREYLAEMQADIRYKDRFLALTKKIV